MDRFKDQATRDIWERLSTPQARRAVPPQLHARARHRLQAVFDAESFAAFSVLPSGAQFKELHGPLRGTFQLRIGGPFRIRFKWTTDGAAEIEAGHFHDKD